MGGRHAFPGALCGLALLFMAGCGGDDDNGALSYEETGDELVAICQEFDTAETEDRLSGDPGQDAPLLAEINDQTSEALDEIRALEVHEELVEARDEFVSVGEESLERGEALQTIADEDDRRAYLKQIREFARRAPALGAEADAAASQLGAPECGQNQ